MTGAYESKIEEIADIDGAAKDDGFGTAQRKERIPTLKEKNDRK